MSTARAAAASPVFDEFLFAVIREETNGTPLSVISALSRLGLEPWQEAARLAALPATAAAEALAALLGRLPSSSGASEPADRNSLASGLIELLPKPSLLPRTPDVAPVLQSVVKDPRRALWGLCIVLAIAVIVTWVMNSGTPPSEDITPPPSPLIGGR